MIRSIGSLRGSYPSPARPQTPSPRPRLAPGPGPRSGLVRGTISLALGVPALTNNPMDDGSADVNPASGPDQLQEVLPAGQSTPHRVDPDTPSSTQHREGSGTESVTKRSVLFGLASIPMTCALLDGHAMAATAAATAAAVPLADLPMIRLKLPQGSVGREYVALKLNIGGKGPYDFMVDSGLTAEMISPHLNQELGKLPVAAQVAGLGAGGATNNVDVVELKGAELCCGEFPSQASAQLPLPSLNAVVIDFPQEHIDPEHDPVEGMLGMEVLQLFDADFDFPNGRIRLWPPGTASKFAASEGLVELPAAVLNESGVIGIRATAAPVAGSSKPPSLQPFVGIIDCGASFSAVNLSAAKLMGLDVGSVSVSQKGGGIVVLGVDGRPLQVPTSQLKFSFVGDAAKGQDGKLSFNPPPPDWKAWEPVQGAVGDLPVFAQLLGDPGKAFKGPAALIGLDILSQRRFILEAVPESNKSVGRRRKLFMSRA